MTYPYGATLYKQGATRGLSLPQVFSEIYLLNFGAKFQVSTTISQAQK